MKLFLSLDWGTSSFRIRLIETDLEQIKILHELNNSLGVSSIQQSWNHSKEKIPRLEFFINSLNGPLKTIKGQSGMAIDGIPLVISGMASSSIGMYELPYSPLPLDLIGGNLSHRIFNVPGFPHPIVLISGVSDDHDVMRGEETQLLGCHDAKMKKDSVYIFPGTHSKHIHVRDGKAIGFKTYMTGELFHLLTEHSILRDNVEKSEILSRKEFISGMLHARSNEFLGSLFTVRTNIILDGMDKGDNYSFLSGLLIGHEILELVKNDYHIYLCPNKRLSENYTLALEVTSLLDRATILSHETVDRAVVRGQLSILINSVVNWK